jgi:hypothetical protein
MDYDYATREIVLYHALPGGSPYNVTFQTWVFRGGDWVHLLAPGIASGFPAGMAYDPQYKGEVMVGAVSQTNHSMETWLFQNSTWRVLSTNKHPPLAAVGGGAQSLAYDYGCACLLQVFPGSSWQSTWRLANGSWALLKPSSCPSERWGFGMAFDRADGYLVEFGGETYPSTFLNQTWVYH